MDISSKWVHTIICTEWRKKYVLRWRNRSKLRGISTFYVFCFVAMGEEEIGVNLRSEMIFLQCLGVFYVRKGDLEETLEYVDFLMCKRDRLIKNFETFPEQNSRYQVSSDAQVRILSNAICISRPYAR